MYVLCTLTPKGFMIRILGQKNCLDISYESLNIFFFKETVLDFFPRFGRNELFNTRYFLTRFCVLQQGTFKVLCIASFFYLLI